MGKKKSRKWIALVLVLLAVVVVVFVSGLDQDTDSVNVGNAVKPQYKTIERFRHIPGNLYPVKEIEVKSSVSGILESYYVKVGSQVHKGDVVAKIRVVAVASELDNVRRSLKLARIQYENDRDNYFRDSALFVKDVVSKYDLELAHSRYMLSRENYLSAQNQLALIEGDNDLLNVVVATSEGVISDLPLKEGQSVVERSSYGDGTTVAQIAQPDFFVFRGKVVEEDVLLLEQGMEIDIVPLAIDTLSVKAVVEKISTKGKLDQGIMKYDVEAVFKVPDNVRLFSGFNATATLLLERKENVLTIPERCLVFRNDCVFVNKADGESWKMVSIDTGMSDGVDIEIVGGLASEDFIELR